MKKKITTITTFSQSRTNREINKNISHNKNNMLAFVAVSKKITQSCRKHHQLGKGKNRC